MIRIAFIGSGPWSELILDTYMNLLEKRNVKRDTIPEFEICGFWSKDESFSNEFSNKIGSLKKYNTLEEILNDEKINLVEISGPDKNHVNYTNQALKMGKHVSLAPPPATNLRELELLIDNLKKFSRLKAFRIINLLDFASPFKNLLIYSKKRHFGTIHTINISSFSYNYPEDSLFGTFYSVIEYVESILGKIEIVLGWSLEDVKDRILNKTDLNYVFIPKNNAKHGTWMHQYIPGLKAKNKSVGTEFIMNVIGSSALAFAYGPYSGIFNESPISRAPGVYWCHKKDHEWKSDIEFGNIQNQNLNTEFIKFLNSINNGKFPKIEYSKIRESMKVLISMMFSLQNNFSAVKTANISSVSSLNLQP